MDKPKKKSNPLYIAVLLAILLTVFLMAGYALYPPSNSTNTVTPLVTNNIQNQTACISEAQSEVNNDPLYQPVGGDAESISLAQGEKATAMQSKIADCKSKYPTN
jgi:hypothetical protein